MEPSAVDPNQAGLSEQARCFLVRFSTGFFDVASEPENDINPIPGHAALAWLREGLLAQGFEVTAPAPEDWGWYADVTRDGERWLLGASGEECGEPSYDWTIQVVRKRSLLQSLLGRQRMNASDPLLAAVLRLCEENEALENVEREASA